MIKDDHDDDDMTMIVVKIIIIVIIIIIIIMIIIRDVSKVKDENSSGFFASSCAVFAFNLFSKF